MQVHHLSGKLIHSSPPKRPEAPVSTLFPERGAERVQQYLLIFLELRQCGRGICSEQGSGLSLAGPGLGHWRGAWAGLSLGFLVRRMGLRTGPLCRVSVGIAGEMPSEQVAGGRAHRYPECHRK